MNDSQRLVTRLLDASQGKHTMTQGELAEAALVVALLVRIARDSREVCERLATQGINDPEKTAHHIRAALLRAGEA